MPGLVEGTLDFCAYRGRVVLVVNTASRCGFTGQYEGLEALHRRYRDRGLVVVGVPANDFGRQEPGSNREIAEFCKVNYGVTFPLAGKASVSGPEAHPLFKQLASRTGVAPKWNFHKYLIDRRGERVVSFDSAVEPLSARLTGAVERALAEAQ